MKKTILLSIMLSLAGVFEIAAQDALTFTWKAESNEVLGFAIMQTTNNGEFTVNWGDGTIEKRTNTSYVGAHTYATSGEYTVTVAISDPDCRIIYIDSRYNNNITHLDLSNCPMLRDLDCEYNQLTELDLSNCPNLQWLNCDLNRLTHLDLSGCPELKALSCEYNQLTQLDLSHCLKLFGLGCGCNQLARLDVSGCSVLERLSCPRNQLTHLDLSGCSELKLLRCYLNQLTELDLSNCPNLQWLYCSENRFQLSELFIICLSINTYQDLGTQNLPQQTAIIGEELFSEQSVFNGVFTKYLVTKDGNPASESDYTVVDGKITFNSIGTYTVAMTNEAIISSHQVIVEITVEKGTGMVETLHATSLQVFPNPTNGELRITNQESGIGNIEIFDATGKSVFKKQLSIINHQLSIDISHLPAGIYFLHADEQTVKVVKK